MPVDGAGPGRRGAGPDLAGVGAPRARLAGSPGFPISVILDNVFVLCYRFHACFIAGQRTRGQHSAEEEQAEAAAAAPRSRRSLCCYMIWYYIRMILYYIILFNN